MMLCVALDVPRFEESSVVEGADADATSARSHDSTNAAIHYLHAFEGEKPDGLIARSAWYGNRSSDIRVAREGRAAVA